MLIKASSPAAGLRHAGPRPMTTVFGMEGTEESRESLHIPWTDNGERPVNDSSYGAGTAQGLFSRPEAECHSFHSPLLFPFPVFPPSNTICMWSDAGRDSSQLVPSLKCCVGAVWGQGVGSARSTPGRLWVGRSAGSWVLWPCRNTAKMFMGSDRGARIHCQCLVMPGELEQPEKPPEQRTCWTDGLLQFFDLVDPDFAFYLCWWLWPRSRGVSVPAGEGALPESSGCWVPALPSLPLTAATSWAGNVLGQAALTGSQPWSPDKGIAPCALTDTYWAIHRHYFFPKGSAPI